jgi:hypothetical protein
MLDTHDFPMVMAALLENRPWARRCALALLLRRCLNASCRCSTKRGLEKFEDQVWKVVPPTEALRLCKTEAQVPQSSRWTSRRRGGCAGLVSVVRLADGRSGARALPVQLVPQGRVRQGETQPLAADRTRTRSKRLTALLQLRRFMNEVLVDQLPMLRDLQRWLEELQLKVRCRRPISPAA